MLSDSFKNKKIHPSSAVLILENGEILWGQGIGAEKSSIGELCFNTSQTGYQETLTDPSYAKQIITFTFPHIGIVGTNSSDLESNEIYAEGCVINQPIFNYSNWRAQNSLDFFFKQKNIPCIYDIDTRYLTKKLANKGAIKAAIINFGKKESKFDEVKKKLKDWSGLENLDLASLVSTDKTYKWNKGLWNNFSDLSKKADLELPVTCLDFGMKQNILRNLYNLNLKPTILKSDSSFDEIMQTKPYGIFLSNGPGDPYATGKIILPVIKQLIKSKIPIFGICLGHQLLSLALGAKTKKMFQGHRGCNHPVKNIINKTVEITSQNHGFDIDRNSIPKEIEETHVSLFDNTNEGLRHKRLPIFSVQYHPEASPGPHDSHYLFKDFYKLVEIYAKKN
tara:strand:- start:29 stop:1207 length:1179 start_codon:yes stop_codon:yes gene_type:complete